MGSTTDSHARHLWATTRIPTCTLLLRSILSGDVARAPSLLLMDLRRRWYDLTGSFDEALLLKTVDAFMELELPKFGYNYG